ncbi:MAG TPA: hypothetical protein VIK91_21610 [Nannocystis sp.]
MTLVFERFGRAVCLAGAVATLAACGGDPGDTGGATNATAGESTTSTGTTSDAPTTGTTSAATEGTMSGSSTTAPTTGTPDTTTGETTGETTTTGDGTTASTTEGTTEGTTGGTTGALPEGLEGSCVAACETFYECVDQPPFPNKAECVLECMAAAGDKQSCAEAYTVFNHCLAMLDCAQFEKAYEEYEFGPCDDEFVAVLTACPACEGYGAMGGPDECLIGQQCPNEPAEEYHCFGDTCTCMLDGQPGNTCPADGFCGLDFDAQRQAANACCGFDL